MFYNINYLFQMKTRQFSQRNQIDDLEEQIRLQIKKVTLMEGDQKQLYKQAEETKKKNNQWLQKLKQQNKMLKGMRDQMIRGTRQKTSQSLSRTLTSFSGNTSNQIRNQAYYRRELDKNRHLTRTKKAMLTNLQDKLKEVQDNKISYIQQSPMMRQIRILENRLDKIMIKYNQAHSIRTSYEQIVKRLKAERVGYDNQITAIERSLRGKQNDFEQLLLLAHDATHSKQQAQAQLKKFQHKRAAIKDLRQNYVANKKDQIQYKKNNFNQNDNKIQNSKQLLKKLRNQDIDLDDEEVFEYEDAFRKLKEATGVTDANEIILKFKTQGNTTKSLQDLKDKYKQKIQQLKKQKQKLKNKFNVRKYSQLPQTQSSDKVDRKKMDQIQQNTNKIISQCERWRVKLQKSQKIMVNVKAGVQHLQKHLNIVSKEQFPAVSNSNIQQSLVKINNILKRCYNTIKNDPGFKPNTFKQSSATVQKYLLRNENNRIQKNEQQLSDNEFDEQLTQQVSNKIKQKNLLSNSNQQTLGNNSAKPVRKLRRFMKSQI